ncbi:ABC transporter permease [Mesorhizobium sp.]|uniref:ABC transporter permease n=1 Tax=Mesorhizobium sp. TaxID=1871066 RepID=UPI000FE5AC64|nr:ABC transporter permease [Mesorhizobium sp.]RWN26433.1 MAG: ABC transporter permease [Mesorhizobium sp.]
MSAKAISTELDELAASSFRRASLRKEVRLFALVAPLLIFLGLIFVIPIGWMLLSSIEDPEVSGALPNTANLIQRWDGAGLPSEEVIATLAIDIEHAAKDKTLGQAGMRLNSAIPGFQSLLTKTAEKLSESQPGGALVALSEIDKRWTENRYWLAIRNAANKYSLFYFNSAFGFSNQGPAGDGQGFYLEVLVRTLWMTLVVTTACVIVGYPLAYFLATISPAWRNILILFVLLPFWTSLLVRTVAWFVLLQKHGVVNDVGIYLGLWSKPLDLIYNRFSVYVAMTHVMLPFMVLPLYSVMLKIPKTYMNAAATLGARPFRAFKEVYLPLSFPGLGAGILLVFIVSLGFYITPALLGGPADQMLSYYIAQNASNLGNLGLAAALSVLLLSVVAVVIFVFGRLGLIANRREV